MDLDFLLRRHQLSLVAANRSMTPRDRRAHEQFARDYSEHRQIVREALGAPTAPPGSIA